MKGDDRAQVVLSPIATPLPLTFVGLLLASLILAGLDLGWIPKAETHECGWALVAVPIPLQLIAAVFGFHGRSATAATGSSTLAAAWLAIALDLIHSPAGAFTPSHSAAMLSIGVAAALAIPFISDARGGSLLPAATLALASVRFVLGACAGLSESTALRQATGVASLVVAAAAFYTALALELEGAVAQDPFLPTFRRTHSASALVAPLDEQVADLEHEAGVRKNL